MIATVGYIGTGTQTIIKADIAEATSTMTDMTQRVGITVTEPADATFEMHDPFEGLRDLWVSIERSVLQIKKDFWAHINTERPAKVRWPRTKPGAVKYHKPRQQPSTYG